MRKSAILVGTMVAALALVLGANPASARPSKPTPPGAPVVVQYTCLIGLSTDCPLRPYASQTITPPGGSSGLISASGTTTARVGRPPGAYPCTVDYRNSSSEATWWGSNPYRASSVTLTDVWDTDYIAATGIGMSDKPSGSIDRGNGRLEWSTTLSNEWRLTHYDSSIRMNVDCFLGRLTGVNYNVSGTFQFGGSSYRINGYDGAGIVT